MQRRNRFAGLLAAILVGSLIAVGVQAFSDMGGSSGPGSAPQDVNVAVLQPTILVPETPIPTARPLEIKVGSPMPEIVVSGSPVPTAEPLPTPVSPPSLAADETIVYANDFHSDDVSDWEYAQIFNDPMPAPAWMVRNNQYVTEALMAPENRDAMTIFNDMIALPPTALAGDGAVETDVWAGTAPQAGLVLGYADNQNYIALIFGTTDARTREGISSGLMLVQVENGERTILAHDTKTVMEKERWYHLRLEHAGNTISASVDDGEPLTATLSRGLVGQKAGLYAGSEGFVYFDNVRVVEK